MFNTRNTSTLLLLLGWIALVAGCDARSPASAPKIQTTTPLPDARIGAMYSVTLRASGGRMPLSWSGNPPAGLTLESHSGKIAGTPEHAGSFHFQVTVTDSNSPRKYDSRTFELTVAPDIPLAIRTESPLPSAGIGRPYTKILETEGGGGRLRWSSGNLADDFALNRTTGAIEGTPERIGNFTFDVRVSDEGNRCASRRFVLGVLGIITETLPDATLGQDYGAMVPFTLRAAGGILPFTWSGALPADLTLDPQTGRISGVPASAGEAGFDVTVTDSSNPPRAVSKRLRLRINPAEPQMPAS